MNEKKILTYLLIFIGSLFLLALFFWKNIIYIAPTDHPSIVSLSISSNGAFAISIDSLHHLVLWDLSNNHYHFMAKHVNPISAYFIPYHNMFMYQHDRSHDIIIQDTYGAIIKQFHFPLTIKRHVISSDLKDYYAATQNNTLFHQQGTQLTPLIGPSPRHDVKNLIMLCFTKNEKQLIAFWPHWEYSWSRPEDTLIYAMPFSLPHITENPFLHPLTPPSLELLTFNLRASASMNGIQAILVPEKNSFRLFHFFSHHPPMFRFLSHTFPPTGALYKIP